jgi:hypothetical protein
LRAAPRMAKQFFFCQQLRTPPDGVELIVAIESE